MTTLAPEPTTTENDTPGYVAHYECCQVENTALCGADLSGGFDVGDDDEDYPINCRLCVHLCGEAFCPLASQVSCRHWKD